MGNNNAGIVLAFLSAAAQVWAALVAFGGVSLKNRISESDRALERFFQLTIDHIRPISSIVGIHAHSSAYMHEESLFEFIRDSGDFSKQVSEYEATKATKHYLYDWGPSNGLPVKDADFFERLQWVQDYAQGYFSEKETKDAFASALKKLVITGCALVLAPLAALLFTDFFAGYWNAFLVFAIGYMILSTASLARILRAFY